MIKDKLFIVSHGNCPPCEIVEHIVDGQLPIHDIAVSDDAWKLVQEGKVKAVPTVLERVGDDYRKCELKILGDRITIDCNGKHLEIQEK